MSTSTKFVVLGLVARRPSYGYALIQQLEQWAVDPEAVQGSSVYQALKELKRMDLIAQHQPVVTAEERGNQRTMYAATEAGEQRLSQWLAEPPGSYDELRMRIGLARPDNLDALIEYVTAAEVACLERISELVIPSVRQLVDQLDSWEAVSATVLGRLSGAELQGRITWLRDTRVQLEELRDHLSTQLS